jgi:hypothetical protein
VFRHQGRAAPIGTKAKTEDQRWPKADYYKGLTIEGDEFPPRLTIDGNQVEGVAADQGGFLVSEHPGVKAKTLYELGQQIIDRSPQLKADREAISTFEVGF